MSITNIKNGHAFLHRMLAQPADDEAADLVRGLIRSRLHEDTWIDFKDGAWTARVDRDELRRDITAFANSDGGCLVIGVSDVDSSNNESTDRAQRLSGCVGDVDRAVEQIASICQSLTGQLLPGRETFEDWTWTGTRCWCCRSCAPGDSRPSRTTALATSFAPSTKPHECPSTCLLTLRSVGENGLPRPFVRDCNEASRQLGGGPLLRPDSRPQPGHDLRAGGSCRSAALDPRSFGAEHSERPHLRADRAVGTQQCVER
ncbi:MAG: ATP-binding protein [Deltaproteobacteria bacterium]|nr:ATP-binding protein [Deltaproteobacteria bacterium]